eukprot:2198596-Prymnesium_polylepis.2
MESANVCKWPCWLREVTADLTAAAQRIDVSRPCRSQKGAAAGVAATMSVPESQSCAVSLVRIATRIEPNPARRCALPTARSGI